MFSVQMLLVIDFTTIFQPSVSSRSSKLGNKNTLHFFFFFAKLYFVYKGANMIKIRFCLFNFFASDHQERDKYYFHLDTG